MESSNDLNEKIVKLTKKLEFLKKNKEETYEIAFHLTELAEEIKILNNYFINLQNKSENIEKHFENITEMLCVHWKYHINELSEIVE